MTAQRGRGPTRRPLDQAKAEELKGRRRALGWSQNAVALAAGISESRVAKYETLRVAIPPDALEAIEGVLSAEEARRRSAG